MSSPFLSSARVWLAILPLALALVIWADVRRIQRIEHIAQLSRGESQPNATSPTGYAGGIRERVLPDHDGRSYEWIAQTQHMLADGIWRVRKIDEENAPFGRPSHAASPYRWWLGSVAWVHHRLTRVPLGLAVDRAALYADPLLHLLLLLALTLFAARYLGALPAAAAALGSSLLFPFAGRFLPGAPDDASLEAIGAIGGLLPLLVGWMRQDRSVASTPSADRARPSLSFWFALAGVFGGFGFWINPGTQAPVTGGIILGALFAAWIHRSAIPAAVLPWRVWGLSGGITVLLASLVEFYPAHLADWELRSIHPLYGLSWIGAAELLERIEHWAQDRKVSWRPQALALKLAALLAMLALPVAIYRTGNRGFLAVDSLFYRLTNQAGGVMAPNLADWIRAGGFTPMLWATLLPLLLLVPAVGLAAGRTTHSARRSALAPGLGAAAILLPVACFQLGRWMLLDAILLVVMVATATVLGAEARKPGITPAWFAGLFLLLLPGAFQLLPSSKPTTDNTLTVAEAIGVIERDLAHWLAPRGRAGAPPVVLAPPGLTVSLNYYGGLRGLGTLSWENQEGLTSALRAVISTSRNETAALLRQRSVTHVVVPMWDGFFDVYAQSASMQTAEMFYQGLNRWSLPPWLRPVPYQMPSLPGFTNQSVKVFELVDDQEPPVAASRLTDYFIAMGQLDLARVSSQELLKYPADFGALVARVQLWIALRDRENFEKTFAPLLERLAAGADRYLPWDRRVSLAIALAQGDRLDLARPQVQRCLDDISAARLRFLSSDALYRLLALKKSLGLEIADPSLRALAVTLLPEQLRDDPGL